MVTDLPCVKVLGIYGTLLHCGVIASHGMQESVGMGCTSELHLETILPHRGVFGLYMFNGGHGSFCVFSDGLFLLPWPVFS